MMTTLYQITTDLRDALDSAFDPDTGELLPAFEEKRALFGSKAGQVAAYILDVEGDVAKASAAIRRIEALAKAAQRKAQHLRDYLASNMAASGIDTIKADDGSFMVKLYLGRDESVEIDDDAVFPAELCGDPNPPTPSKTKIKTAILAGQPVAGARIVRKDRLTIK